jgi:hypothetical protein
MRIPILVTALAVLATGAAEAQGKSRGNGHAGGQKTPPGLAKKGGLPPGQAKKVHRPDDGVVVLRDVLGRNGYTVVRTVPAGDRRHVYYRGRDGVERRAVVAPGDERLTFTDVPRPLVEQIWSRLY